MVIAGELRLNFNKMKKILFILLLFPLILNAQTKVRFNNQYLIVKEKNTDTLLYSAYLTHELVETSQKINKIGELDSVPSNLFPELPNTGWIEAGTFYSYNGSTVMAIQSHNRTIYAPEQTPNLFSFYRPNADTLSWIANEKVKVGWIRVYEGQAYKCVQAHQTQNTWNPLITLGTLWIAYTADACPNWIQPGSTNPYMIGNCVTFNGRTYKSTINNNVWSPAAYPAGWQCQDCQ